MDDLSIAMLMLASFGGALILGAAYAMMRKPRFVLEPNSTIRLKTSSGAYRSRVAGSSKKGLMIYAPLQRDAYVPLREGEVITCEVPVRDGVWTFSTPILERDLDLHLFTLRAPVSPRKSDRREDKRISTELSMAIEGEVGVLKNISPCGARIETSAQLVRGDRVRLDLPFLDEPLFAYVLSIEDAINQARVRFEETLELGTMPR